MKLYSTEKHNMGFWRRNISLRHYNGTLLILLLLTGTTWFSMQKNTITHADMRQKQKAAIEIKQEKSAVSEDAASTPQQAGLNQFERVCGWRRPHNSQALYGKCVPPLRNFVARFKLAAPYKLAYGMNEKSMSTLMREMMCFLSYPERFLAHNISIIPKTRQRNSLPCMHNSTNELDVTYAADQTIAAAFTDFTFFTLVRDPLERFISAYIDKCINEHKIERRCYDCYMNLTCLVERQYERAMHFDPGAEYNYEDLHFHPQNWNSNFHSLFDRVRVIKYAPDPASEQHRRMLDELFAIFRANGVPHKYISLFRQQIASAQTDHVTFDSQQRRAIRKQIFDDEFLRSTLLRLYYFDYKFFGFEMPSHHQ